MKRKALVCCVLWLTACASPAPETQTRTAAAPPAAVQDIPIRVLTPPPSMPGPHPAVVILHDCSGLGPRSSGAPLRWADELTRRGYVVLIPDSFSTRGHAPGVCTESAVNRAEVSPLRRVRDAYLALAYARTLPDVDPSRIGVMGGSHGGSTTLLAMVRDERDTAAVSAAKLSGFKAAVALYPRCATRMGDWRANESGVYEPLAPLLILVGEKDDWTPAEPCRKLTEASRANGLPVDIKIYPGAQHSFDSSNPTRYVPNRSNANAVNGRGATTGGDPAAWADSIVQVETFFAGHLRAAPK